MEERESAVFLAPPFFRHLPHKNRSITGLLIPSREAEKGNAILPAAPSILIQRSNSSGNF